MPSLISMPTPSQRPCPRRTVPSPPPCLPPPPPSLPDPDVPAAGAWPPPRPPHNAAAFSPFPSSAAAYRRLFLARARSAGDGRRGTATACSRPPPRPPHNAMAAGTRPPPTPGHRHVLHTTAAFFPFLASAAACRRLLRAAPPRRNHGFVAPGQGGQPLQSHRQIL